MDRSSLYISHNVQFFYVHLKLFHLSKIQFLKTFFYYFHIEKYHKKINDNEYEYYPDDKKFYTTKKDKLKVVINFKNLAKKGVDPMPTWHDEWNFKVPEGKFRLVTGRHAQFTQSGTTNNMMLRDLIPTNYLWINKRVANKKGIKFGDMVEVASSIGKVKILAYPTNQIHPQVVWFAHGFNSQNPAMSNSYNNGANDNEIIEDKFEKIYGCATMHHTDVTIRKI